MAVCSVCGKKVAVGNNVSFSKRHTKRIFKPNLQNIRVADANGNMRRQVICTQCLKAMYKTTGRRAVPDTAAVATDATPGEPLNT